MQNDLLSISVSNDYKQALKEWKKIKVHEISGDETYKRCLCHGTLKNYMIILQNIHNNNYAFVGKDCFNQFQFGKCIIENVKTKKIKQKYKPNDITFELQSNMNEAERIIKIHDICLKFKAKFNTDILKFGKHKGEKVRELAQTKEGRRYLYFTLSDKFKWLDTSRNLFR